MKSSLNFDKMFFNYRFSESESDECLEYEGRNVLTKEELQSLLYIENINEWVMENNMYPD